MHFKAEAWTPAGVRCMLGTPSTCTVTIIDNDHGGVFAFERELYDVTDYTGHATVTVVRGRGARGKVLLPYKTVEGTANPTTDYKHTQGMLAFENEQSE